MPFVEIRTNLPDHRKAKAMARELGMRRAWVVGHLVCLWTWALDNVPSDGSLAGIDQADLEEAAQWPEERAGELLPAMVRAGFVDAEDGDHFIHDWDEYAGRLLRRREEDRDRKRAERAAARAAKRPTDTAKTSRNGATSTRSTRQVAKPSTARPADNAPRPVDKVAASAGQPPMSAASRAPTRGRPRRRTAPHPTDTVPSTDPGEALTARAPATNRRSAGDPYLEIKPGDDRYPVAKLLATRFGWTSCSQAEWDDWWEEVDNEFPTGTTKGRDRAVAWQWLTGQLAKCPRDVADPKRWFFEQRRRVKDERLAVAEAREEEHDATKGAELHPSIANGFTPGSAALKPNWHAAPRMSRDEERAYLLGIEGTLEPALWTDLLTRRGWTPDELHADDVDFGAGDGS